jgi:hypothetical protein
MDKKWKFTPGGRRQVKITRLIAEMICIYCQPFQVVGNPGIKALVALRPIWAGFLLVVLCYFYFYSHSYLKLVD